MCTYAYIHIYSTHLDHVRSAKSIVKQIHVSNPFQTPLAKISTYIFKGPKPKRYLLRAQVPVWGRVFCLTRYKKITANPPQVPFSHLAALDPEIKPFERLMFPTLVFQSYLVRIGVWTHFYTSWGSAFRGSFSHRSSQGLWGDFGRLGLLNMESPKV